MTLLEPGAYQMTSGGQVARFLPELGAVNDDNRDNYSIGASTIQTNLTGGYNNNSNYPNNTPTNPQDLVVDDASLVQHLTVAQEITVAIVQETCEDNEPQHEEDKNHRSHFHRKQWKIWIGIIAGLSVVLIVIITISSMVARGTIGGTGKEKERPPTDVPTVAYTTPRYIVYSKLTDEQQQIVTEELNYNEETWNVLGTNPIEEYAFYSLVDTQQAAALQLNFEEESWDCVQNHYFDYYWSELEQYDLATAWITLGYTKDRYDAGDDPATFDLFWAELTPAQQAAAVELCYVQESWDEIDLTLWQSTTPRPAPVAATAITSSSVRPTHRPSSLAPPPPAALVEENTTNTKNKNNVEKLLELLPPSVVSKLGTTFLTALPAYTQNSLRNDLLRLQEETNTNTAASLFSSDPSEFVATSSMIGPQLQALQWILNYELQPANNNKFFTYALPRQLQRFALITVYFAISSGAGEVAKNPTTGKEEDATTHETLSWYSGLNECSWYDAVCHPETNLYEHLIFRSSPEGDAAAAAKEEETRLRGGRLVPELGMLSTLTVLEFVAQGLIGSIPTELGTLSLLQQVSLNTNVFRGTIPRELFQLPNLVSLDLGNNVLAGTIPLPASSNDEEAVVANRRVLASLNLRNNTLTGIIPTEIGMFQNLRSIELDHNYFTGTIPATIRFLNYDATNFQNDDNILERFQVNANALTGLIPPSLFGVLSKTVRIFDVSENQLTEKLCREAFYGEYCDELFCRDWLYKCDTCST